MVFREAPKSWYKRTKSPHIVWCGWKKEVFVWRRRRRWRSTRVTGGQEERRWSQKTLNGGISFTTPLHHHQFRVLDEACVAKDKDLLIQKYKLRKTVFNMKSSNFVPDKYHHQSSVTIHLRQPTVERLSSCYSKGWPWVTASTYRRVLYVLYSDHHHQGTPVKPACF